MPRASFSVEPVRAGILNMNELARRDIEFQASARPVDANAYELNTPTGIVDLRTATRCARIESRLAHQDHRRIPKLQSGMAFARR